MLIDNVPLCGLIFASWRAVKGDKNRVLENKPAEYILTGQFRNVDGYCPFM